MSKMEIIGNSKEKENRKTCEKWKEEGVRSEKFAEHKFLII